MSDFRTRDDLIRQALTGLKVIGSGQAPDADDSETISAKIDGLFAELAARSVATVTDDDRIPSEWFNALADLLANECAPAFGAERNPAIREDAEARLKVMTRQQPQRLLRTDTYFRAGSRLRLGGAR